MGNVKPMRILFILFFIASFSCNQSSQKTNTQVLDFKAFTIEVPSTWKKFNLQGIDSYVGGIAIDKVDTISFDIGPWSNSLTEDEPVIWERNSLQGNLAIDTTQVFLVDDRRGIDPDKYRRQTLTWDTIDGREAKIVYPRKPGVGITGVYFDSLWISKFGISRFNLYGRDLRLQNQRDLLEAIKTLKFYKQK